MRVWVCAGRAGCSCSSRSLSVCVRVCQCASVWVWAPVIDTCYAHKRACDPGLSPSLLSTMAPPKTHTHTHRASFVPPCQMPLLHSLQMQARRHANWQPQSTLFVAGENKNTHTHSQWRGPGAGQHTHTQVQEESLGWRLKGTLYTNLRNSFSL